VILRGRDRIIDAVLAAEAEVPLPEVASEVPLAAAAAAVVAEAASEMPLAAEVASEVPFSEVEEVVASTSPPD
jgi:hypothetical protein